MTEQPYGNIPLFRDLSAERYDDQETTEMESMCMNCHESGMTRLLLTKIPFFRDVVIMSFECPHCGEKNSEVQPGGAIQERGVKYTVKIKTEKDMSRQIVKADSASVIFPELDFEIPANSQKGVFTTIEGLLSRAVEGLEQDQPLRRIQHPDVAAKIDEFIKKLGELKPPFTVILDDPTGNSFIENPQAPTADPDMVVNAYTRTTEQDRALGIMAPPDSENDDPRPQRASGVSNLETINESGEAASVPKEEVLAFAVNCPECNCPTESRMKIVNIPFFKDIILMSLTCDKCGCKTNEVKSGSGVEPKGKKISLRLTDPSDLNRDILKSETCTFTIPELEFDSYLMSDAGKFTTIEGMIDGIRGNFKVKEPFTSGDSATDERRRKIREFVGKLDQILAGKLKVTVILDDPAGNSYIQNLYAPDPDPEMKIEEYERDEEHNDQLGLTHMKTEGYGSTGQG